MRLLQVLALMSLFLAAGLAIAQDASTQQPLEQAMSPDEFKAAGLEKLSPAELAQLNTWLNRKIQVESTRAAAQAEDKVKTEARGFLSFGSDEPIVSTIVGEFRGFGKGKVYKLANGQEWEQTDTARLDGVNKTNPAVKISPGFMGSVWYFRIDGYNKAAKVRRNK